MRERLCAQHSRIAIDSQLKKLGEELASEGRQDLGQVVIPETESREWK